MRMQKNQKSSLTRLIIELNGSQHSEQVEYGQEQIGYLEKQGYKVPPNIHPLVLRACWRGIFS